MPKTRNSTFLRVFIVAVALTLLSACGGGNEDLVSYVQDVRSRPTKAVPTAPKAEPFKGFVYQSGQLRDPFRQFVVEKDSAIDAVVAPQEDREKEPLEKYVLNDLKLIGTLHPADADWALIQDPDGVLHRVTVGNYIGQNDGQILSIDNTSVLLRQVLPDGFGGYKEEQTVFGNLGGEQ